MTPEFMPEFVNQMVHCPTTSPEVEVDSDFEVW